MECEKPTRPDSEPRMYVAGNNKVRPACRAKIISDLFPPRLPHAISPRSPGGSARQIWSRIISRLRVAQPSRLDQLCVRTFVSATSRVAREPTGTNQRDEILSDALRSQRDRSADKFDPKLRFDTWSSRCRAGPTIAHLDLFHQDFAC